MHISIYWNLLYFCSDIWIICVHFEFGLRCSRWVIFMVVYTHEITCFRGGVLSRNTMFSVCLWYSHEINFMRVTLTKSISWRWLSRNTKLIKSVHECDISQNTTKSHHENTDANLATCYVHEGGRHGLPIMKIIHGGELSRKCDFRDYYRESWSVTVYPHALFSWE